MEEQGARPFSRVNLGVSGCCGFTVDRSVAPLFFNVLGEVWGFFAACCRTRLPLGSGCCAEVVRRGLVRANNLDVLSSQVGPVFFLGGGNILSLGIHVH